MVRELRGIDEVGFYAGKEEAHILTRGWERGKGWEKGDERGCLIPDAAWER